MHTIQWKNTNKIQHKKCKNWTKYKYIVPRSHRYACNRNNESTMRVESNLRCGKQINLVACSRFYKECSPQGHSLCTRRCSDMEWHISAVDHKTTRLCIALSAHGSTRAKCIRSNGRIQIRSNTKDARTGRNTIKIQHKRCSNWTKYKYIDPHSNRYACNRNTESTMEPIWPGLATVSALLASSGA